MSKKEWDMKDFDKPKSKNVLKKTTTKQPEKFNKKTRDGKIIVYMTKHEEVQIKKTAAQQGLSAAAWIRLQLKLKNPSSY